MLNDFAETSQQFAERAVEAAIETNQLVLAGIRYQRRGGLEFSAWKLFVRVGAILYLNGVAAAKSVRDRVVYDNKHGQASAEPSERYAAAAVFVK